MGFAPVPYIGHRYVTAAGHTVQVIQRRYKGAPTYFLRSWESTAGHCTGGTFADPPSWLWFSVGEFIQDDFGNLVMFLKQPDYDLCLVDNPARNRPNIFES